MVLEKQILFFSRGTKVVIDNTLFSSQSKRNLLSFNDICCNGYNIDTNRKNEIEYLNIIPTVSNEICILEKLSALSSGLYYTHIRLIKTYSTMNLKFMNPDIFAI